MNDFCLYIYERFLPLYTACFSFIYMNDFCLYILNAFPYIYMNHFCLYILNAFFYMKPSIDIFKLKVKIFKLLRVIYD